MPQSKQLTEFYQAYAKWLDKGAPAGRPFRPTTGLCYNIRVFCKEDSELTKDLKAEMNEQFIEAGLGDEGCPFNNSETNSYFKESFDGIMHLNPERIKWVREHANASTTNT